MLEQIEPEEWLGLLMALKGFCMHGNISRVKDPLHMLTDSSSIIAAESKKSGLNSALSRLFRDGGWEGQKHIGD